jgi:hypothetical protein
MVDFFFALSGLHFSELRIFRKINCQGIVTAFSPWALTVKTLI